MCGSIPLILALSFLPAQTEDLEIVDARGTYGFLGAPRPKEGGLPGEIFHFAFNIKGMEQDENGKAAYTLLMEVFNKKGEAVFRLGPRNSITQNYLGGDLLPCSANLTIPLDTPPGIYSLKVTIEDRKSKKKAIFESEGKILPLEFGLIRVGTFSDPETRVPTPPVGVVGESMYVNFSAVAFALDPDTKQPNFDVALKILDEKGKQTLPKPLVGKVQEIPSGLKIVPMRFGMTLNRPGLFQLELSAHDRISGKSSKVTFPLRVIPLY